LRLIGSREVQSLAGLSSNQLREWTGRRGLVTPDRPAQGKGRQARFSWQTVLVLRLALTMKQDLHIELQAHRKSLAQVKRLFQERSFAALSNKVLLLEGEIRIGLSDISEATFGVDGAAIVVPLAPHLKVLTDYFGMTAANEQLPLFRAAGAA
jgi:hypothetical protein